MRLFGGLTGDHEAEGELLGAGTLERNDEIFVHLVDGEYVGNQRNSVFEITSIEVW